MSWFASSVFRFNVNFVFLFTFLQGRGTGGFLFALRRSHIREEPSRLPGRTFPYPRPTPSMSGRQSPNFHQFRLDLEW